MSKTLTRKERIEREKQQKAMRKTRKAGISAKRFWIEGSTRIEKESRA